MSDVAGGTGQAFDAAVNVVENPDGDIEAERVRAQEVTRADARETVARAEYKLTKEREALANAEQALAEAQAALAALEEEN